MLEAIRNKIKEYKERLPERRKQELEKLEKKAVQTEKDAEYYAQKNLLLKKINDAKQLKKESEELVKESKESSGPGIKWEKFGEGGIL